MKVYISSSSISISSPIMLQSSILLSPSLFIWCQKKKSVAFEITMYKQMYYFIYIE